MIANLRFPSSAFAHAARPPSRNPWHPRPMTRELSIGEVARQSGVNVQTVRYYERRGMLPEPRRAASGYRMYSFETVGRIRFIRRTQQLGFTLAEIEDLLALRDRPDHRPIHAMAFARLQSVEEDLRRLAQVRETLQDSLAECDRAGSDLNCSILRALNEGESP